MALPGFTAALSVMNDTGGTTYTAITPAATITIQEIEINKMETTNLNQSNPVKTYIGTLMEPGKIMFSMDYTKAGYNLLFPLLGKSFVQSGAYTIPPTGTVPILWKIVAPNDEVGGSPTALTFTSKGYLDKLSVTEMTPDGRMYIKGEIQCSDLPTIA